MQEELTPIRERRKEFEKEKELSYSNSLKLELTYDFATGDIPIPFHNGAKRYYEDCGYSTN
jgi:TRAP-type uncharacterized transport system substrate-binding protein